MGIFRNLSYAIDAWLCRNSNRISASINFLGIVFWVLVLADAMFFIYVLGQDLLVNHVDDGFAWAFYGSWIIGCIICSGFAVVMMRRCWLAMRKHGWRLAY